MLKNPFIVFAAALTVWFFYFYAVDMLLMEGQGLPLGWDLFPR